MLLVGRKRVGRDCAVQGKSHKCSQLRCNPHSSSLSGILTLQCRVTLQLNCKLQKILILSLIRLPRYNAMKFTYGKSYTWGVLASFYVCYTNLAQYFTFFNLWIPNNPLFFVCLFSQVFIPWALSLRVSKIFECVIRGMERGSVPRRGKKINYESLALGSLKEVRHVFARIVIDTIYPPNPNRKHFST